MIEVNVTATNFTVVSSSTNQNFTITSDNSIFTITNTVNPTVSITNTNLLVTFLADGNVNPDPVFRTVIANTATIGNLIATSATIATIGGINTLVATTGTFTNLITQNFNLNGLQYPSGKGLYGQVLSTNGSSYANWTNLGDLVFWSLNSDLLTNGYNIVSGSNSTPLTIGVGVSGQPAKSSIEFSKISPYNLDYVKLSAPNLNNGQPTSYTSYLVVGGIQGGGNLGNVWKAGNILLDGYVSGNGFFSPDINLLTLSGGIQFGDGSVLTTANITTNTNTGTSIVPIATNTRLGVVKIGSGLTIQDDGTLSGAGSYTLPAATSNTRGGVRLGTGITVTDGDVISVNSTTFITTSTNVGKVSLTEDMTTNGYYIRAAAGSDSYLLLGSNQGYARLSASYSDYYFADLKLHTEDFMGPKHFWTELSNSEGIDIIAPNINLVSSNETTIGTASTSTLNVQRIYNHAGTYAPTFPAGIQFGDNSVQVTAWQTSTLYQQYIDFQNPQDP